MPWVTTKRSEFGSLADRSNHRVRHVWVTTSRGEYPGLILEWAKRAHGWVARVAMLIDDDGGLLIRWVDASQVRPATSVDPARTAHAVKSASHP